MGPRFRKDDVDLLCRVVSHAISAGTTASDPLPRKRIVKALQDGDADVCGSVYRVDWTVFTL